MKRIIFAVLSALLIAVLVVPVLAATCTFAWKDEEIQDQTSSYTSDKNICMVIVKASIHNYTFTKDECKSGYCVSGIGTNTAVAYKQDFLAMENSIDCYDISNVKYYVTEDPTAVSICNFNAESILSRILAWLGLE